MMWYGNDSGRTAGGLLQAAGAESGSIILEFKYTKDESCNLQELAQEAIAQIKDKKYDTDMTETIYYIGLAHCGKKAESVWEKKQPGDTI